MSKAATFCRWWPMVRAYFWPFDFASPVDYLQPEEAELTRHANREKLRSVIAAYIKRWGILSLIIWILASIAGRYGAIKIEILLALAGYTTVVITVCLLLFKRAILRK